MASIIDITYFQEPYAVAQKEQPTVAAALQAMIDRYEDEYLRQILGYELYKSFIAGIAIGSPIQKWLDVRDGKEFTNTSGDIMQWIGFKNSIKRSPIANYVYCKWMEKEVSATTGTGEKKMTSALAVNYTPGQKMTKAWNEMVEWNRALCEFLEVSKETYTEFKFVYGNQLYHHQNILGL